VSVHEFFYLNYPPKRCWGQDIDDETEQWSGIGGEPVPEGEKEKAEEYEDEEHLATVTVVEDFDPHTITHGPPRTAASHLVSPPSELPAPSMTKRKRIDIAGAKASTITKKIRYETKSARKAEKDKQRARRTEKAERAGGKSSRKPGRRKR
jgi:ribosomal RNA-processing protein 17